MTDKDSFVGSALAEKEMDSTVEVKANASENNIDRDCRYKSRDTCDVNYQLPCHASSMDN